MTATDGSATTPAARPGDFRLSFGRHAGRRLADLPHSYVEYLARESGGATRRAARAYLLHGDNPDGEEDPGHPDPGSAAVRFPLLVWRWREAMRDRHRDDPLALAVVEDGFAELKTLCTELTGRRWPTDAECGIVG
ncbi:MAG: hypothetical protein C0501_30390 [Isosphaera sp.]|nr:hypothetical protein [Isosphaera sp.]